MDTDKSKTGGTPVATDETAATDSVSGAPATPNDTTVIATAPESSVATPPAEESPNLAVSDDIAEQIAADSAMPPSTEPSPVNNPTPASEASTGIELPDIAMPPAEASETTASEVAEPSDVIKEHLKQEESAPAPAVAKAPKAHNPAVSAVAITISLMIVLAGLAVFAYTSS